MTTVAVIAFAFGVAIGSLLCGLGWRARADALRRQALAAIELAGYDRAIGVTLLARLATDRGWPADRRFDIAAVAQYLIASGVDIPDEMLQEIVGSWDAGSLRRLPVTEADIADL